MRRPFLVDVRGVVERLVVTDGRIRGVEPESGRMADRRVVFAFPRVVPDDALPTGPGCRTENGWVTTDTSGRAGVPGVGAVGNVVDPRAMVITAAGMGTAVAFALDHDLVDEQVSHAVADHRATVPR
ncbi:hypothetical protein [Streptomyces sp. Wb2n-11]|uniref:hypothetical protein n=1 Tax=Streptomyces sp. Wb2n-11 TaxID=1030533 RepID=UPI000A891B98|nr:hypothetical protein [Streptomyces sp. Wb2n-11]